jgi:hypothetical protein
VADDAEGKSNTDVLVEKDKISAIAFEAVAVKLKRNDDEDDVKNESNRVDIKSENDSPEMRNEKDSPDIKSKDDSLEVRIEDNNPDVRSEDDSAYIESENGGDLENRGKIKGKSEMKAGDQYSTDTGT